MLELVSVLDSVELLSVEVAALVPDSVAPVDSDVELVPFGSAQANEQATNPMQA